jgi:hypothetical protein
MARSQQSNLPAMPELSRETVTDLVERAPNGLVRPKSMTLGRLLTRPLVAIAHTGRMIIECTSEMREETLMAAGRTDKEAPATLIDVVDWTNPEAPIECMLVCNAMMKTGFTRYGGALTGKFFAVAGGDIVADKRYRHVDIREINVER